MIREESIRRYILDKYGDVDELNISTFTGDRVKGYGYGEPILITFRSRGKKYRLVLNTIREDRFGHEYISDRSGEILWSYKSFNKLDRHVRAVSVGYIDGEGNLRDIDDFDEFYLITEYREGKLYKDYLFELGESYSARDLEMVDRLAKYLAGIHSVKPDVDKWIYIRRIRDLIGHGECIMGIVDSYIWGGGDVDLETLKEVEYKALRWRWRLRRYMDRLSVVHGDFHPWNIIWIDDDFILLDRSRGEYGEPADDVAALTINYIFISLLRHGILRENYKRLYTYFFERYLKYTGDEQLFEVIQPFYAWRGLVVANPVWYPNLDRNIRDMLIRFVLNVLDEEFFEYDGVEKYLR